MSNTVILSGKFLVLAIGLAGFVLLFGAVSFVDAVACQDWETGAWNKEPSCDETLTFEDPGVAELAICEYRIVSIIGTTFEETKGWTSAGSCSGSTWTSPPITIYINTNDPATGQPNCKYEGGFQCVVYQRAQDNFGNKSTNYDGDGTEGPIYKIDYSSPSGGSISYTDGFTSLTSVAFTVNDGTDSPGSGIDEATRIVKRKSATLSGGICGTYGSFAPVSFTGTYPNFTDSTLVSDTCYQYQYLVSDNAEHQTTYTSLNEVKVDTQAPTVNFFDVDPEASEGWVNMDTPNVVVSWNDTGSGMGVSDSGGSGLRQIEVWRAFDTNGNNAPDSEEWAELESARKTSGFTTPTSDDGSYTDTSLVTAGTYWYGLHVVDKANNIGYEPSPEKVQVDTAPPGVSVAGAPGSWKNFDHSASVSCTDAGSGCDTDTYGLKINTVSGDCSTTYGDYTLISPQTVASHRWVCAAAKDQAGNEGFSEPRKEFMVDKNAPIVSEFFVSPPPPGWVGIGGNATISWTVSESVAGESHLQAVEIWQAPFASGSCENGTEGSCSWSQQGPAVSAPLGSDGPWQDSSFHAPESGVWWYGIHVVDNAGNWTQEPAPQKVQADKTAPSTTIAINGGASYATTTSVTLNLSCSDAGSGCSTMEFSNDGVSFSGPEPVSGSKAWGLSSCGGTRTVWARHADGAGNTTTNSDSIICDNTPPDTTITDAPEHPTSETFSSLSFASNEPGSTFQCEIDGGGFSTCESPKTYTLSPGQHTFFVRAIDSAGNIDPTPASHTWTITGANQPPVISGDTGSGVTASPNPTGANSPITFEVTWDDQNNDDTKLHICKTDGITGQTCDGGSWCDTASFSGTSPSSCEYVTQEADAGSNTYYAFVCDTDNACSSSVSGEFFVDTIAPAIFSFEVPFSDRPPNWINNTTNPAVTVSWNVSDSGGSDLQQIEVWRAPDLGGAPDPALWAEIVEARKTSGFDTPSSDTDSYDDTGSGTGIFWYGLHVVDNAGNVTTEDEAQDVQSDKNNPVAILESPEDGGWWRDDFTAVFNDSDIGSGLAATCEYQIIGDPGGEDLTSGILTRSCNLAVATVDVGPLPDICRFEGANGCRVHTQAFDIAGNVSTLVAYDFGVDFTAPVVGVPSPSTAQAGTPQTFVSSLTDPVGKIGACTFYWGPLGNPWENYSVDTIIDPIPCQNGGECTVSVDHTFQEEGEYDIVYACADFSQPEANTGYQSGTVTVGSLSHTLTADPASGATTTPFDFISQVSGTLTGLADFKYDCTNDGSWEYEVDGIDLNTSDPGWVSRNGYGTKVTSPDTFAVRDLCQYDEEDTYTAKGQVQRDTGTAEDTVAIEVTANGVPSATNLQHNNSTANYCFVSSPPVILSWTFLDPDVGDSQSAYQVQVATNPGFGNPVINTGKVASSNSQYSPLNLAYDKTYYWRVKVWDSTDTASLPEWATGPSLTTPEHAYPRTDFSWAPAFPGPEDTIQFTDETVFAVGSTNQSWFWQFGDGASSTLQNPVHTYEDSGSYIVSLESTDDVGTCGGNNDVDGDGIPNNEDEDIDGDGIVNEDDPDIDGDGIANGSDPTPNGGTGGGSGGDGGGGGLGQSIINVTLPLPDWQEISPF